ncbi:hypothetical protein OPT61_g4224 [Boeremia exigua]|uniref:Uncharacterized protein n=1 Tax=Boeremia exigua TaxID=749465 RepID=A0ACC2IER5_9PLEO|nr:hypothetical protein OPT61_g4224 [Boeremia exigua]
MLFDFRPEEYPDDATGSAKLFNLVNTVYRDGVQSDDVNKFADLITQTPRMFNIASKAFPPLRLPGNWPIPTQTDNNTRQLLERTREFRTEKPLQPYEDLVIEHDRNVAREISKDRLLGWVRGLGQSSHPDQEVLTRLLVLLLDALHTKSAKHLSAPELIAELSQKAGIVLTGTPFKPDVFSRTSSDGPAPPKAAPKPGSDNTGSGTDAGAGSGAGTGTATGAGLCNESVSGASSSTPHATATTLRNSSSRSIASPAPLAIRPALAGCVRFGLPPSEDIEASTIRPALAGCVRFGSLPSEDIEASASVRLPFTVPHNVNDPNRPRVPKIAKKN